MPDRVVRSMEGAGAPVSAKARYDHVDGGRPGAHVAADAPATEVITMPTAHDVSALAVVSEFDVVIGVLTRTDVLQALERREQRSRRRPGTPQSRPARDHRTSHDDRAGDHRR